MLNRLPPEFDGAERMRAWQPIDGVWLVHVRLRRLTSEPRVHTCIGAVVHEALPGGQHRTRVEPILSPAAWTALGSHPTTWAIEYVWYPPADAGGEWTERRYALPRPPGEGRGE